MLLLVKLVLDDPDGRRTRVYTQRQARLDLFEDISVDMLDLDGEDVDFLGELAYLGRVRERAINMRFVGSFGCKDLFRRAVLPHVEKTDVDVEQSSGDGEHTT